MTAILLLIPIFMFLICILMLTRNNLVYGFRTRSLEETSEAARRLIQAGNFEWQQCYEIRDEYGTYDQMMWSLNKWRYEDFYPAFQARLAMIEGETALAQ